MKKKIKNIVKTKLFLDQSKMLIIIMSIKIKYTFIFINLKLYKK